MIFTFFYFIVIMFLYFFLCLNSSGDLILTESPTIWVQGHHPFTEKQITEIDRKILKLSDEDKNAFFDMWNVFPELR